MIQAIEKYTDWLHGRWPAGTVEKLPEVNEDYSCNVPGIYVVGDLTGIPLLKFSLDSGAKAVRSIVADKSFKSGESLDLLIIGAGVSGMAAGLEAKKNGLSFKIVEASGPFFTISNFPAGKPIYTYPTDMVPAGDLQVSAEVKEPLLDELNAQTDTLAEHMLQARVNKIERVSDGLQVVIEKSEPIKAKHVILAIGRTGNFRSLGVPGEKLPKVYNRLHDPKDFCGKKILVVGGGDSAMETAIALTQCGCDVMMSYRKPNFARAKPENIEMVEKLANDPAGSMDEVEVSSPSSERVTTASGKWVLDEMPEHEKHMGKLTLLMGSNVKEIREDSVSIKLASGEEADFENAAVFLMIGREAPLDFFRRSKISLSGEGTTLGWLAFTLFMLFCVFLYSWKSGGPTETWLDPWPGNMPSVIASMGSWFETQVNDRSTLLGTLAVSLKGRSFYYTFAYSLCVVIFGVARIRRRKTPYVKLQTNVLMAIQVLPLFLLPELILPWLGYNGLFTSGFGATFADNLFEKYISNADYAARNWPDWGHPRAYWRAYGLVLAWPLMIYNVFTENPMPWWLVICGLQTFVFIPAIIYYWGKGAYCGWICSCGALAETLGDTQRKKMPHGKKWNYLNMAGQVILLIAFLLLGVRIAGWIWPDSWFDQVFPMFLEGRGNEDSVLKYISYKWVVDVFLAGILGVGMYFKYSGRVWCRFFCPLAALMHIYARFTKFRIFSEKSKCISCNVCTSVCHQGIDIMNFANKGVPMEDPECVRCSACVQSCPTGVLSFGRYGKDGEVKYDRVPASLVQISERRSVGTPAK